MIATISPSSFHYEETHNTLVYADRAKGIQLNLRRNSFSVGLQPRNYNNIIESLNRKNVEQCEQIGSLQEELRKLRSQIDRVPDNPIVANCASHEKLNAVKNSLEILFQDRLDLRRQLMECESNLKKFDLRLLFRKYDIERHKLMASDDYEMNGLNKNDPLQSLFNQKLHFSHQKSTLEEKVEENETKIKRIENELREQTDSEDWLIDTFFNNHNMIAEFKDKSFAERHSMEIAKELLSRLDTNEEIMTESVKLNRHSYHCLNGMGRLSEELGSAFSALLRRVEGKKNVVWRDDISSPKLCKRREVENIFSLPTYSALPKTPQANTTRALVSICTITPSYSFCANLTPEKSTPLRPLNSIRNSLTSTINKSSKVAVVPAYNDNIDTDHNENDPMNGTFTIENNRTAPSPTPSNSRSCNGDYWKSAPNGNGYRNKPNANYSQCNREGMANRFKSRSGYQSPRSTYSYNQWNRDSNYSYRNNGYNAPNRHYRTNGNKSPNATKSPYLPRFRF